jgi:GTPase SAR1 family protein
MTDLDIIKQIEKELNIELKKSDISNELYGKEYRLDNKNRVIGLGLWECGISNLDFLIAHLKKFKLLKKLNLSKNEFTNINPLSELQQLSLLNLRDNFKLHDISSIKYLKNLEVLKFTNSQLTDVESLENLNKLKVLWLEICGIRDISAIQRLIGLEELILYDNPITDISALQKLTNLTSLSLTGKLITDISALQKLTNLIDLEIINTSIKDISPLKELKKLKRLELKDNSIEELPSWITNFNMKIQWETYVKDGYINLYNNPLKSPPIDVVKEGKEAVSNYFYQIEKEKGKTEYLFEAKLLVIGEGGTGKTTFTRKMQNINAEMPQDKDTTLGIEVGKWNYSIDFPKMQQLGQVIFHVNLWDFGGQKVYQGTHQIFFSDKSFYVLIADTREQKTDFSYWLNTVEQLGGDNSFLIIVLNKKYGHEQKFDESGFRNHFGKLIKEVIELDLKDDKSRIYDLQDKVKMYLKQLPGIGDALPPSWVSIREDLLKEKVNFISFDRFREICSRHNIKEISMIHTLSGYFNRIGAFTHYIDDPILQERIYLNSNWLVKTVYEVLDNESAKSKKGRLTELDIKKIWENNELHYEVNKLAQLMHKFGLMYHIPDSTDYVVPAHLPTVTPYEHWEHSKNGNILQFIYEFDKYMPQGIMSRLIIALNHHIKDHSLVWHRGVNIESNEAYAEIIESYGGSNRFEIRIAGINKIELLAIIRERFAEVLKPFNNLNYKQLVPCICEECKCSTEPGFHEYDKLLKFREKGTGSQCPKTGEIISAEELLKVTGFKPKTKIDAFNTEKKIETKTIKIFLASSSELEKDRKEFREFISVENDRLNDGGIYLKIVQWEYFIDAMAKDRLQAEYNKAIKECDIFLSLFFTKVGKYTTEEFEAAFGKFIESGKPLVYTYFKNAPVDIENLTQDDFKSRKDFEEKLKTLGHFKNTYTDINDLQNKFKRQLEFILSNSLSQK